mgnify:CR=1 FL=1
MIKKAGSWFSYGDKKIGQGRDAVKELLKKDEALAAEIEQKVRDAMKNKRTSNRTSLWDILPRMRP